MVRNELNETNLVKEFRKTVCRALDDAADLRWVQLDEVENYDLPERLEAFFKKNKQKL